jgi:molybdopterin-synthase adenylyltransferase
MMKLSSEEVERYARHIVMQNIGGAGQLRLKQAKILVIGAGGLGAPVLLYLAAAGIGTLGIVDDDAVSLSNLQRQVLFKTQDVGRPKVEAAQEELHALNPHVSVQTHNFRLTQDNAKELISGYGIVIDGCDNFATRLCVAQMCETLHKPLLSGAVGMFDASLTLFKPYEKNNPRYQDLYPELPPEGSLPACSTTGVVGALTGVLGSLMALEAIKEICGIGEGLVGKLLMYDSLSLRFEVIAYGREG